MGSADLSEGVRMAEGKVSAHLQGSSTAWHPDALHMTQGWGTFFSAQGRLAIYNIIHRPYRIISLKISLLLLVKLIW